MKKLIIPLAALVMPVFAADNLSVNNPDKFAWELFEELSIPADESKGRGVLKQGAKIGDAGSVLWETWISVLAA